MNTTKSAIPSLMRSAVISVLVVSVVVFNSGCASYKQLPRQAWSESGEAPVGQKVRVTLMSGAKVVGTLRRTTEDNLEVAGRVIPSQQIKRIEVEERSTGAGPVVVGLVIAAGAIALLRGFFSTAGDSASCQEGDSGC